MWRKTSGLGVTTVAACLGPQIQKSWKERPDGLLLHEDLILSLFSPRLGMRQYWRDIDSLERWTRSEPHRRWWRDFLRDSGGTGFWHEAYFMGGGVEAIYDDMAPPMGFARLPRRRRHAVRCSPPDGEQLVRGALTVAPLVSEAEYHGATADHGESSSTSAA